MKKYLVVNRIIMGSSETKDALEMERDRCAYFEGIYGMMARMIETALGERGVVTEDNYELFLSEAFDRKFSEGRRAGMKEAFDACHKNAKMCKLDPKCHVHDAACINTLANRGPDA